MNIDQSKQPGCCRPASHYPWCRRVPRPELVAMMVALSTASGVAQPGNDGFQAATALAGEIGSTGGDNLGATKEAGEPNHAGNTGGRSVWWRWTAPVSGGVAFDTSGSDFNTLLAVYRGDSVGALESVASNDDSAGGLQSILGFAAVAGTTYWIAVDGFRPSNGQGGPRPRPGVPAQGNVVLNWGPPPANDDFGNAIPLSGATGSTNGSSGGATRQAGEPEHPEDAGGASVWWRWTAPQSALVIFDTIGSDFDTLLAVYTGDTTGGLSLVAGNDDGDVLDNGESLVRACLQ